MYKKVILVVGLVFFVGIAVAFFSSGDLFLFFGKIVGISSILSGGDYTLQQSMSKTPLGIQHMTSNDGVYELIPDVGIVEVMTVSKLENDLSKAHCYPNPYKPSLGHTKITFSRLTSYTKLKVFNIAGELVYEEEKDTPNGELPWNVTNNNNEKLASGVYIYLITDKAGNKAKGRFAVIK